MMMNVPMTTHESICDFGRRRVWCWLFATVCLVLTVASAVPCALWAGEPFDLQLQTRDETGQVLTSVERFEPERVAIVAVDVWNFHWCKTATERVACHAASLPRPM